MNWNLLDLRCLLSSEENHKKALGIPSVSPPTTAVNHVYNIPTQPLPVGCPTPCQTQPQEQTSAVDYPPPRGVPWKCITEMMRDDKSCTGCHLNKPYDPPRLKLQQEVGCLAFAKNNYILRKDVKTSATIVDQFNNKFARMTDQSRPSKPGAKRVS